MALSLPGSADEEWLVVVSFNAHRHTHLYSAGWLLYTDFGLMCCQAIPLRFPPSCGDDPIFFFPRSYSRASFQSKAGSHFLFCLTILCRASSPRIHCKRPLSCGSFPTSSVQRLWWRWKWWRSWLALIASGLHCSATFIKSQWARSIYDCE